MVEDIIMVIVIVSHHKEIELVRAGVARGGKQSPSGRNLAREK